MAKWLLHRYLQVALNVHSARAPISGYRKSLSETGKFRNNV